MDEIFNLCISCNKNLKERRSETPVEKLDRCVRSHLLCFALQMHKSHESVINNNTAYCSDSVILKHISVPASEKILHTN